MKYKAILFDMDGVITNTEEAHYEAWRKTFLYFGYNVSKEMYQTKVQSKGRKNAVKIVMDTEDQSVLDKVNELKTNYYAELVKDIEYYQDAIDLIDELSKMDVTLAIVSSSSFAEKLITQIQYRDKFQLVVSGIGDMPILNKPAPDIFLYAMDVLGVSPNECLVIEDSISGVKAGIDSGAEVLGINRENLDFGSHDNLKVVTKLDIKEIVNG